MPRRARAVRVGATTLALGAAALSGAAWTADRAPEIEDQMRERVEVALIRNDLGSVEVDVDGRDVHLHGVVEGDQQAQAQDVLESIAGIRDRSYGFTDPVPGRITATINQDRIVIESSTTDSRQAEMVDMLLASDEVTRETTSGELAPITHIPQWSDSTQLDMAAARILHDVLVEAGPDLAEADILITTDLVKIDGVAHDEQAQARVEAFAADRTEGGLTVETDLEASALSLDAEVVALVAEFDALADEIRRAGVPLFESDADVLTPKGIEVGDRVAAAMDTYRLPMVEAIGHTDAIGDDAYNLDLSGRRSSALVTYVVAQGIDEQRMWSTGAGESQPVGDNETEAGRQANRRVEFVVHRVRPDDTISSSTATDAETNIDPTLTTTDNADGENP